MSTPNEAVFSTLSYMSGEIQALTTIIQAVVVLFPDLSSFLAMYDSMEQNGLARVEASPAGDEAVTAFQHKMSVTRSLAQQALDLRRGA
jgi:hypothetical protein